MKIGPVGYAVSVKASDMVNVESRHLWYMKQCWAHCEGLFEFAAYLEAKRASIGGRGLYECLQHGVGFVHEHQDAATRGAVVAFYKSAAIKVLVAVHSVCYELERLGLKDGGKETTTSVVVLGTKYHCALRHRLVDYALCDVVQMLSFMNCGGGNGGGGGRGEGSRCGLVLCHENREWFWKRFLWDSLAIESQLDTANHLEDALNAEIVAGTVSTADDAIDFMTWTLYYFRLTANPNYYNLRGVDDGDLSQHLSAVIEEALHRLLNAQCISVDEGMWSRRATMGSLPATMASRIRRWSFSTLRFAK